MDVLVVGAGPAGATLAGNLAEFGFKVTVVDKAQLPRFKPCSGGIPAKCRDLINLEDSVLDPLLEDVIHRVHLTYDHRDPVFIRSQRPLVYMVSRDRFDHALIGDAARKGARIVDGVEVLGVDPAGRRVRVRTTKGEMSARVVVGADGVHSAVARSLGLSQTEKLGLALQAELHVSSNLLSEWRGVVGADFGRLPNGIGWVFPKSDHLSVGLLSFNRSKPWRRDDLFEFLNGQGLPFKPERVRVYSHYLPRWHGQRSFQHQNVLLLGDAAGIVNPMTGAGLEAAMRSAQIASEVIKHAFWHGDDLLVHYSDRIRREVCRELIDARAMAKLFFNFTRICYQLGIKNPSFSEIAARLLTGAIDYTEVWKELARAVFRRGDGVEMLRQDDPEG